MVMIAPAQGLEPQELGQGWGAHALSHPGAPPISTHSRLCTCDMLGSAGHTGAARILEDKCQVLGSVQGEETDVQLAGMRNLAEGLGGGGGCRQGCGRDGGGTEGPGGMNRAEW